jgi:putative effector of murein hydrolase LrgA (UPF0299 family)
MMDFIMVPLVVGIITLGIYKLFELFVGKRERLLIIEKLGDKLILPVGLNKISLPGYNNSLPFSFGTLKTGCLLIGIGLGMLVGFFICIFSIPNYYTKLHYSEVGEISAIIYGSCVLFFGGLGLIISFLIEMKNKKGKNEEMMQQN